MEERKPIQEDVEQQNRGKEADKAEWKKVMEQRK